MILLDLCGTLYDSNTTFDFLDFYLRVPSYRFFRRVSKTFAWRCLNRLCLYGLKRDLTRSMALKYLKGKTRGELEAAAELFFDQFLCRKENSEIVHRVAALQKEYPVWIVSATLDFIACVIARRVGIERLYASQLAYKGDVCRGYLQTNLLLDKAGALKRQGVFPPYDGVITDNLSDLALIREARLAWVVTYPRTHRRWVRLLEKYKPEGVILLPFQSHTC